MGPVCAGPALLTMIKAKKIGTQAAHTAAEKPLGRSTVTRSNFRTVTTAKAVGAASSATAQRCDIGEEQTGRQALTEVPMH